MDGAAPGGAIHTADYDPEYRPTGCRKRNLLAGGSMIRTTGHWHQCGIAVAGSGVNGENGIEISPDRIHREHAAGWRLVRKPFSGARGETTMSRFSRI